MISYWPVEVIADRCDFMDRDHIQPGGLFVVLHLKLHY